MNLPSWKDGLPSPPPGARLQEAWLTSFEQPDSSLLVEHFLPSLLGLSNSLSQEEEQRCLFFGELGTTLESLRGRLTVISSPPVGPRVPSQYPWLFRYVSHFSVGSDSRAVQHAKLWAFHWTAHDDEFIELHISSTNLTSSAFKTQIQAGWRLMLPLTTRSTKAARQSWGELARFVEALGKSAGAQAALRTERLLNLLGRAECPGDFSFIASIPGDRPAGRHLKKFSPTRIHVLTPTVGDWNERALRAWSNDTGVAPKQVSLKWISTKHPWKDKAGWTLSSQALSTLNDAGVQVHCLPHDARFSDQHSEADSRWSHAKLYLLRCQRKRRLLLTSANWSISAWGAGTTSPRNFELGVLFDTTWSAIEGFAEPFTPPSTRPYLTEKTEEVTLASPLEWAEAEWDGQQIRLQARTSEPSEAITVNLSFAGTLTRSISLAGSTASVPWADLIQIPLAAQFAQGAATLEVDIHDLRPPADFAKTALPEVDPAISQQLRADYLLQRYGGPGVESLPGSKRDIRKPGPSSTAANYSLQAWVDARDAFSIVDQWQRALKEASRDPLLKQQVRFDGHELLGHFEHTSGPAAALVAEEFRWRLEEEC